VFENQEVVMNPAMTQSELVQALEARHKQVGEYFSSLPEETFLADTVPKWNPAQHLIHLTRANSRIAQGFQARDALPNNDSGQAKSYEVVRETYLTALAHAPSELLAKNGAAVQVEANPSQSQILEAYQQAGTNLRQGIQAWTEAELDAKAMPHPLLGLLSVREMLEFALYHDLHHLEGVRKTLG
jgi:DinB superfamily